MSSTSIVPAAVPSDVHSSAPFVPSLAENSSEVPNAPSESGLELSEPGAMSFTSTVPEELPFDFHSSRPWDLLSTAEKNRVPFTSVRLAGKDPSIGWLSMSLISRVPAAVPSDFHSSTPFVPSLAVKNTVPFTSMRFAGEELPGPGAMSLTITVPSGVPSDLHSSVPLEPSLAVKNTVLPTATRSVGSEGLRPGLMSVTIVVPAAVPFDFHSSRPCVLSTAAKNGMPFTLGRSAGTDPTPPGRMSRTRAVPVAEALLFHSSGPVEPSSAWNRTIPLIATRSTGLDPALPGSISRTRWGASASAGRAGASNEPTATSATSAARTHGITILRPYRTTGGVTFPRILRTAAGERSRNGGRGMMPWDRPGKGGSRAQARAHRVGAHDRGRGHRGHRGPVRSEIAAGRRQADPGVHGEANRVQVHRRGARGQGRVRPQPGRPVRVQRPAAEARRRPGCPGRPLHRGRKEARDGGVRGNGEGPRGEDHPSDQHPVHPERCAHGHCHHRRHRAIQQRPGLHGVGAQRRQVLHRAVAHPAVDPARRTAQSPRRACGRIGRDAVHSSDRTGVVARSPAPTPATIARSEPPREPHAAASCLVRAEFKVTRNCPRGQWEGAGYVTGAGTGTETGAVPRFALLIPMAKSTTGGAGGAGGMAGHLAPTGVRRFLELEEF